MTTDATDATAALSPEDRKIVTLARAARARRPDAPEGAAVRDDAGRTYVASTVALDALRLSALQVAVATAVASGATSLEAAAVVSDAAGDTLPEADLAAVRELGGPATPVLLAGTDGRLRATITAP